jgi:hypothetical protein
VGFNQCCGSASGIQCFIEPWIRDGKKIKIWIREEHPGSYFRELKNSFFGLNIFFYPIFFFLIRKSIGSFDINMVDINHVDVDVKYS